MALNERLRPMDADAFARRALDDVARNRGVIIHPAAWRLLPLVNRLAPWLLEVLLRREYAQYARVRALLGR